MVKKITILLMLLSIMLVFVGCDDMLSNIFPTTLKDSRFNGSFSYYEKWVASNGINEKFEYTVFKFDGTSKASYYSKRYSYYSSSGWSYTGDYIGDYYRWDIEFDVQNGNYRWRLWDNPYSEWGDWESYSFSSDGNTLTLFNYYNINGLNKILTKSTNRSASAQNTSSNKIIETNKTPNGSNALVQDKQLYLK